MLLFFCFATQKAKRHIADDVFKPASIILVVVPWIDEFDGEFSLFGFCFFLLFFFFSICLAKASTNWSIRSLVLPKSAIEVIVVTGVSAFMDMRLFFSSMATASTMSFVLYDRKPALVFCPPSPNKAKQAKMMSICSVRKKGPSFGITSVFLL